MIYLIVITHNEQEEKEIETHKNVLGSIMHPPHSARELDGSEEPGPDLSAPRSSAATEDALMSSGTKVN